MEPAHLARLIKGNAIDEVYEQLRLGEIDFNQTLHSRIFLPPLLFAASCGHFDIVTMLLAAGADVTQTGGLMQRTCLHYAVIHGECDILPHLISIGANLEARDDCDRTPLYCGVFEGRYAPVATLLSHGASVNACTLSNSPLHLAAQCGHVDLVDLLLERGADPWLVNEEGAYAWHLSSNATIRNRIAATWRGISEKTTIGG